MTQTAFALPETFDVADDLQVYARFEGGYAEVQSLALWSNGIPLRLPDELLSVPGVLNEANASAAAARERGEFPQDSGWCNPNAALIQIVKSFFSGSLLSESIADLADARAARDEADDAYKAVKKEQDDAIKPLVDIRKAASGYADTCYERAAAVAEAVRAVTGETSPDPDVLVKLEHPALYNPTNALLWAIENRKDAFLTLDRRAFDANVREGKIPQEIARLGERFKAFITPNLSHRRRNPDQ